MAALPDTTGLNHSPAAREPRTSYPPARPAAPPWRVGETRPIDLRRLVAAFRRRLRLFSVIALLVFAAVVAATLLTTPKYAATAQVMVDPRNQRAPTPNEALLPLPADSAVVDTEVEVLRSPQLAARVVDALRLDRDPEFSGSRAKDRRKAVRAVSKALSVERDGLTYVIRIGFESEQPMKAANIANKFAELYIARQLETKAQATRQAAVWLSQRIGQLRRQVLADEGAVQQFKIANNLLSASGATLTEQEISNYNESLAQAQAQVAEDQARLNTARSQLAGGSSGDDVGETLNSPTIQKLKEARAEASKRVASLSSQFKDDYPVLKVARSELADIDAQINAETRRIISNLDAKAQVSRKRAGAIESTLSGAQGQLASNNRATVALNELERNAQASRALYEAYLARYKETSAQEGLHQPDANILSLATTPTSPHSPNLPLNFALGVLLAIGAGASAIALAEMLDAGLGSSADVERRFQTRYLGAIPLLESVAKHTSQRPIDYVVAKPFSSFSEAFRSLRASIVYGADGSPVKVVAVTSALPGEGKTTTAVCLGRAAALQGPNVLIVDCDLRRGNLREALNTDAKSGLLEVLDGQVSLEEAVIKDSHTDADILSLTHRGMTPKDVFGGAEIDRLLAHVKRRYDFVVLDTAPILALADSRVLARKADFVLIVARWRATPSPAIEGALRLLAGSKVQVGGIILNQVDMQQQARYAYGDPANFFNSYRQYYLEGAE